MTKQEYKELEERVMRTQKAVVDLEKAEDAAKDNLTAEKLKEFEERTAEVIEMCWNNLTGLFGKIRDQYIKDLKYNLKVLQGLLK